MNILKTLRKPHFALFLTMLILFVSCEQYSLDRIERNFNYEIYKVYKDSGLKTVNINFSDFNGKSPLEEANALLQTINIAYESDLVIPENILAAMITLSDVDQIKAFLIAEELLSVQEITNLEVLAEDVKNDGLETALVNLENQVLSENLSAIEFKNYEDLASTLKIIGDEKFEVLNNSETTKGVGACLIAYALWLAALIGFAVGCATVFLCVLAGIGLGAATLEVATKCAIK